MRSRLRSDSQGETTTHKFDTVQFLVFPEFEILVYVPLVHPLGKQAKPVIT